ncbi:MAG: APC family permease [Thermoplasmata archaeon]|nr:APC family permease [Thermoplasmata archaeon]
MSSEQNPTNNEEQKVQVFVRKSSGLVRPVGGWDTFFATFMLVTGGVPIFLISLLYLAPGANWNLAYLLMFIPSLSLASVYTLFGISMPRSGGDYVFVSRGLHPFLGFVNSFVLFFAFVFSIGVYAYMGAQYIVYAISTWAFIFNSSSLMDLASALSSSTALLISGTIIIVIFLLLLTFTNTRTAFKVIFWSGIVILASTIIYFAINATITPQAFSSAFDKYAGSGAYQGVINSAVSNGLTFSYGLSGMMLALPIAWYAFTWYTLPANWSGEMRQVKKSLPIGIIGSLVMILIYYLVFYNVSFYSFGEKFLTAWSYNYANGLSLPFSYIGTYTPFFVSLVYPNPIIPFLALLVFWLPDVLFFIPTMVAATRYLFAWSFDRMAPEIFTKVNPRTKVPVISTITVGIFSMAGLFAYVYIPQVAILDVIPLFEFGYLIPALTAILIPFVKKDMYNNAFVVKRKVLGIPVITWLGAIAFAGIIYGIIGLWNSYLMPINLVTAVAIIGIYALGAAIFIAMYFINKRKGINVLYAFKEVPPE